MKKLLVLIIVFSVFLIYSPSNLLSEIDEPEDCWVHIRVDPEVNAPGVLSWNVGTSSCQDVGVDCQMIRCEDYCKGELIQNSSNGYAVKLKLDNVSFKIKDSTDNWVVYNRSVANYQFNNTYYIIIDNCPTKPFLNNLRFELEGIITDAQGYFTVYIPTGTY